MSLRVLAVTPPPRVLALTAWVNDASDMAAEAEELVENVMLVLMKYFSPEASISGTEPVAVGAIRIADGVTLNPPCECCLARFAARLAALAARIAAFSSGVSLATL